MKWIKDEDFIRGDIPMTKFDIRSLTLAYLGINKGDRLLDVGAGTGSVSIEAALQGASVTAIEREEEGIDLIKKNADKFGVDIETIEGQAPEDLPRTSFNKCFIGGSGGKLAEVFDYLDLYLEDGGILTANFIMLKNLNKFLELIGEYGYKDLEVRLVQTAYMDRIGLMKGNNPIYIVKGVKR